MLGLGSQWAATGGLQQGLDRCFKEIKLALHRIEIVVSSDEDGAIT